MNKIFIGILLLAIVITAAIKWPFAKNKIEVPVVSVEANQQQFSKTDNLFTEPATISPETDTAIESTDKTCLTPEQLSRLPEAEQAFAWINEYVSPLGGPSQYLIELSESELLDEQRHGNLHAMVVLGMKYQHQAQYGQFPEKVADLFEPPAKLPEYDRVAGNKAKTILWTAALKDSPLALRILAESFIHELDIIQNTSVLEKNPELAKNPENLAKHMEQLFNYMSYFFINYHAFVTLQQTLFSEINGLGFIDNSKILPALPQRLYSLENFDEKVDQAVDVWQQRWLNDRSVRGLPPLPELVIPDYVENWANLRLANLDCAAPDTDISQ